MHKHMNVLHFQLSVWQMLSFREQKKKMMKMKTIANACEQSKYFDLIRRRRLVNYLPYINQSNDTPPPIN